MNLRKSLQDRSGFTLVEIMIVIMIISLVVMIAVPSWMGARERSRVKACVSQLRQIRYAKDSWAMDNRKSGADTPTWADLTPYIKLKSEPQCPAGGTYTYGGVDELPTCSYGGDHVL